MLFEDGGVASLQLNEDSMMIIEGGSEVKQQHVAHAKVGFGCVWKSRNIMCRCLFLCDRASSGPG